MVFSHLSICWPLARISPCSLTFSYLMDYIWLSRSWLERWFSPWILMMTCWWSSCILFLSCCRTWGNNTLQECLLKSFHFGCRLENNRSYIPPPWCCRPFLSLWPIHYVCFRNEFCQLILVSLLFLAAEVFYSISNLSGFTIFQYPAISWHRSRGSHQPSPWIKVLLNKY